MTAINTRRDEVRKVVVDHLLIRQLEQRGLTRTLRHADVRGDDAGEE